MRIVAVNGSARKGWNTDLLLKSTLEGAEANGAETEYVNLYDLNFKGCIGCLGCKKKGGKIAHCAMRDELTPLLDSIRGCDGVIFGSPIYLGEVSGEMRSFLERLLFQYINYDTFDRAANPLFGRKIKSGFIFTTNAPEAAYGHVGYTERFKGYETMISGLLGECRTLAVSETLQTDDFDKYHMAVFDVAERRRRREEVFPEDLKKAYELGAWTATDR